MGQHNVAEIVLVTVSVLAGISFIFLAIIMHKRLSKGQPLTFKADKLGITLEGRPFGLIVFAGCLLAGAGFGFKYWDDKSALQKMDGEVQTARRELSELRARNDEKDKSLKHLRDDLAQQLKLYNLRLHLVFPPQEPPNPMKAEISVVRMDPDEKPRYLEHQVCRGAGGIVVNLRSLSTGDKLFVRAQEGGRSWRSDDMEVPAAHLMMTPLRISQVEEQSR